MLHTPGVHVFVNSSCTIIPRHIIQIWNSTLNIARMQRWEGKVKIAERDKKRQGRNSKDMIKSEWGIKKIIGEGSKKCPKESKGVNERSPTFRFLYRKTEQMFMYLCFQEMTKCRQWDIIQTSPFPCSGPSLWNSTQSQRVLCATEAKQTLSLYV